MNIWNIEEHDELKDTFYKTLCVELEAVGIGRLENRLFSDLDKMRMDLPHYRGSKEYYIALCDRLIVNIDETQRGLEMLQENLDVLTDVALKTKKLLRGID